MAGGGGTRLWPVSRKQTPKQLLPLLGKETLFQSTVGRLEKLFPPERILEHCSRQCYPRGGATGSRLDQVIFNRNGWLLFLHLTRLLDNGHHQNPFWREEFLQPTNC